MRVLTRYILREVGLVFLITLTALTSLLVLVGGVQKALAEGLGIVQIVQLVPYLLPNALMFAVPGTILFAASSVYGRMSGANEIVALKSLGISPMVILWPTLMLSTLLSFATLWLNDIAMSWSFNGVQRVVIDAIEDIAYGTLQTKKKFSTPAFSVNVKAVKGRKLINPMFQLQENGRSATIRAQEAELRSNPGSGVLTVKLFNGTIDASNGHGEFPNEWIERDIVIHAHAGEADSSPSHLPLWKIPSQTTKQLENIRQIEQQMVARAGFQMMTGEFDALAGNGWSEDAKNLQYQKFTLYRLQTEPPRRWANGFTCLCFALVGAGMAIRMRNSDVMTSFALCFGPILLVYYPLLAFGLDRAKAGAINPYAVWLANVILVLWGLWLLRRVLRY